MASEISLARAGVVPIIKTKIMIEIRMRIFIIYLGSYQIRDFVSRSYQMLIIINFVEYFNYQLDVIL